MEETGEGKENRYWGSAKGRLKRAAGQTGTVLVMVTVGWGGWSDQDWG